MRALFYNGNRSVGFGGIEHWMLDVAAGLRERGHTAVLYGRRRAAWFCEGGRRGLACRRGFFGVDYHPFAIARLSAVVRAHGIDVIFAKGKKGARTASVALRLGGGGTVVLVLGLEGELRDRFIDRWTWRHAVDRGLVLAEEARVWYERLPWIADGKLRVAQKGVDTEILDPMRPDGPAVRAALGIPPAAPVIGMIGRLVWQKGHRVFLHAAARLHDRFPSARFVLVGAGSEEPGLRSEAEQLGIGTRVIFTGYRLDVAALYAAMDVVAIPSWRENMPQVLLEAMAMARPVVATATIGVRELIDDGVHGFVVAPGDVAALAERLASLLADRTRGATMGARARARILDGYTRHDMITRVEAVVREGPDREAARGTSSAWPSTGGWRRNVSAGRSTSEDVTDRSSLG
jgi:glycosyltransferase involved in cell wall biosynthesis